MVAWSQEEKCGLKYDMSTFGRPVRTLGIKDGKSGAEAPHGLWQLIELARIKSIKGREKPF
jgi:hypothetical protein